MQAWSLRTSRAVLPPNSRLLAGFPLTHLLPSNSRHLHHPSQGHHQPFEHPEEDTKGNVSINRAVRFLQPRSLPVEGLSDELPTGFEKGNGSSGSTSEDLTHSPGQILVDALSRAKLDFAVPHPPAGKIDLSQVGLREHYDKEIETQKTQEQYRYGKPRLSYQTITASVISQRAQQKLGSATLVDEIQNGSGEKIRLSDEQKRFLETSGYEVEDVLLWTSILTQEDSKAASQRILQFANSSPRPTDRRRPLPTFVLLFFLRRDNLGPHVLRDLISYGWHQLHRARSERILRHDLYHTTKEYSREYADGYPTMDNRSIMIMVIRFIRHARASWPEALPGIAEMFTQNFRLPSANYETPPHSRIVQEDKLAQLNFMYNRILKLLSIPCPGSPFLSVPYQQRASFDIINQMAEHEPNLIINREGYRSIISLQLASKKTSQERDWDQLKARSWPPWKQDRTGIDADKGVEYGTPGAKTAIERAAGAGYSGVLWEKAVSILSGWDIDRSPTIQTRSLLFSKFNSKEKLLSELLKTKLTCENNSKIWGARIKATRTVREAWACFLSYRARNLPPHIDVYFAMFEKLTGKEELAATGTGSESLSTRSLDAGDAKEIWPNPVSPKEATYVRVPPPTVDELVNEMTTERVTPTIRLLSLLISTAESPGQGMKYVRLGISQYPAISSLITPNSANESGISRVPLLILSAFTRFLCRYAFFDSNEIHQGAESVPSIMYRAPLLYARHILKRKNITDGKQFLPILAALTDARPIRGLEHPDDYSYVKFIKRWKFLQEIIEDSLKTSPSGYTASELRHVFVVLELSIFGSLEVLESHDSFLFQGTNRSGRKRHDRIYEDAESIIRLSGSYVMTRFQEMLTLPQPMSQDSMSENVNESSYTQFEPTEFPVKRVVNLPRLAMLPYPSLIHTSIRVLGLVQHYKGIVDMFEWMITHQNEIIKATEEQRNGRKMLRKAMVATRVFLERTWLLPPFDDAAESAEQSERENIRDANPDNLQTQLAALSATADVRFQIRELMESVHEWGGWPTDEEVEEYCTSDTAAFPSAPADEQMDKIKQGSSG